ncbi:uncharacterized protein LOC130636600 isoform X2 [Hydractinia symbiolongicarpus]|uniref:uncharacterized protein LOC130636600 isoform X2 n=1 Tax=Hydractinia symbiolongicarpus TaxID=13093 RepID=UPI002549E06C|nr:uncharacterized protein LOC130636600 isoform X2 [Hydractinia symbiolongicarpus]XP_057302360.1 uncharacterized protein LOC130636600 isoform X2 [Hydractinia symbiolongicarpus]
MHDINSRLICAVDVFADILSKLLETFVIDHKDSATKTPNVALANILRQNKSLDKKLLASFKHPDNKEKIYDVTSPSTPFKVRIDISSLDISLQYKILTSVEGFLTNQEKSIQCKDPAHQPCCNKCFHQCNCPKKCKNVNHPCTNCRNTQRDCKGKSGCCHVCEKCRKCTMILPAENQCSTYKLKKSVDMIMNLRNLVAHMTDKDCENFENSKQPFSNFSDYKDWKSFSDFIINVIFKDIITFMQNFKNPLPLEECDKFEKALLKTLHDPDVKELLHEHDVKISKMEKRMSCTEAKVEILWNDKIQTGDEHVERLEFKRLDGNACLLKLPVQLNITHVSVSENKGDWKELEDHSFEFDDLHLFVKMKFKDSNSYRFKVIGDRMDLDPQNEEFYSEDVMYDPDACDHRSSALNIGLMCHANGLPTNVVSIISELEDLEFFCSKKVKFTVHGQKKVITLETWFDICGDFVNRNFENPYKEHIKLPVDCVKDTQIGRFADVITNWCSSKVKCDVASLVLTDYDSYKHAEFLGYDLSEVKKKLCLTAKSRECNNRILVYEPSLHVFLNIRVLEQADISHINQALSVCNDDIKMHAMIHREIIVDSNVVYIGLIVIPDSLFQALSQEENKLLCGPCFELILSDSVMNNLTSFKEWEKNSLQKFIKELKKAHDLKRKPKKLEDTIKSYFNRTIGFMATAEVFLPSLRKMEMPSLSCKTGVQVKTVFLTREQQEIMWLAENKLILTGSFGSGKSIIGQLKLKQLYEKAEGVVKIYYVCCESQCLFQTTVQEIAEQTCLKVKKANAQIIARNLLQLKQEMGLDVSVNLSRVMKLIYKRNKNILVHFVFDEYDAENLDHNEASEIKNVITDQSYPRIEESVVILITQSMEKHREYIKVNQNGKERRQAHVKYQFEKTGMKTFYLPTTMRTTTRINDLIKVCVKHFEGNPSVFNHPEFLGKRDPGRRSTPKLVFSNNPINDNTANKVSAARYYENNPATSIPKISISSKAGRETPASLDVNSATRNPVINAPSAYSLPQVKDRGDDFDAQLETTGKQTPHLMDTRLDNSSSVPKEATEVPPPKKLIQGSVNLDVAFKLSNANQVKSGEKTKTEFKFNGTHQVGHNIVGEWPILVSIHNSFNDFYSHGDIASHYSLCLSQIAEEVIDDTEELVVLSCDRESAIMVKNAFGLIKKESICYTPAFHSKDQAQSKKDILKRYRSRNCILITDFVGFMGMEAERLWVFVDKYDHFLKQHLVESLGRCTSELVVFEYDNPKKEKPNDDIEKILQDWDQLVKKITVEVIKGQVTQQLFVEFSHDKSYGLNVMSPVYKMEIDKLKKMKDESNHSTDHKAVMDTIKSNAHDPYFTTGIKDMFNQSVKASNEKVSDYSLEGFAFEDSGIMLPFESRNEINGSLNYRRMILQDRFHVKIEVGNFRVLLKGSVENTERMKEWFRLYFELKKSGELNNPETFESLFFGDYFENVTEDDEIAWSCISFVPTYLFGKIIGKRGENIRRISRQFQAEIVADKEVGKIFVSGSSTAKRNINFYFQFLMFKKNYVNSLFWSDQKIVVVGLPSHDSVKLIRRRSCKDCERNCEILAQIELTESDLNIDNIPSLKEVFSKVVNDMQIQLRKNETTACELMVHHGHIHIRNCQPGSKKVIDMISNGKLHFKNFSQSSYNFNELPYENPYKDIVRYDISVFTSNQSYEMRYKVFLALKDGNVSFITYEEAGILPAKFYPYRVGPGYLCTPPQNVRRIDIVDPTTNTSTRLNFQIFQHNIVPENEIQENITKLKSFYESLSIKSNTLYLDIGTPPEGYLLTYVRRCERKTFKLSNITLLRTSREEIEVRDGLNYEGEIENDIFLTSKLIQGNDIVLQSAEIGLQEILTHSKKLMHNLE